MFGRAFATTDATDAGWGGVVFIMSEPVPCQHSSINGSSPEKLRSGRRGVRRRRLWVSDILLSVDGRLCGGRHCWGLLAPAGVAGALQKLRTVSARRDRGELSGPGRVQARILPRHVLDDVKFRLPLLHHPACRLTVLDGA